MSVNAERPTRARIEPRFTGFAPIATCHWQSLGNIIAAYGVPEGWRRLGLSWGARWPGGGVLLGGGRWRCLLEELFGITVEVHTPDSAEAADRLEAALAAAGHAFVAEVDAFHLPSPYQGSQHVVHTVVVTDRGPDRVVVLDTTNNPEPVELPVDEYRRMRGSPCAGRIEPYLLYLPRLTGDRALHGPSVATAVRADLARHGHADLASLDGFVDWAAGADEPLSVCRVAAERHQAALLHDLLAELGVPGSAEVATRLRSLAEDWYLIHMLTEHPSAGQPRHRERLLRLLRRLAVVERELLAEVTA